MIKTRKRNKKWITAACTVLMGAVLLFVSAAPAYATIEEDTFRPGTKAIEFSEEMPTMYRSFVIRAVNVFDQSEVGYVEFILRQGDGEVRVPATDEGDLNWSATLDVAELGALTGEFTVQAYGADQLGNVGVMKEETVTILNEDSGIAMETLYLSELSPTDKAEFTVTAEGVAYAEGIESVSFRAWPDGGVEHAKTYAATEQDGGWKADFRLADFGGQYGIYNIEAYAQAKDGKGGYLGTKRVDIVERVTETAIMGESEATVRQLVDYYNNSAFDYPVFYEEAPRSTGLEDLAKLYYEVCGAEGVRVEVAWAQMCLETKFLNYGNLVTKEQFNFAGLGATGAGEPGTDFSQEYSDDAEGIRAGVIGHVQHLKCYAADSGVHYLNSENQPYDPRWMDSLRGTVQTVERLEGRWAASAGYGMNVARGVQSVLDTE